MNNKYTVANFNNSDNTLYGKISISLEIGYTLAFVIDFHFFDEKQSFRVPNFADSAIEKMISQLKIVQQRDFDPLPDPENYWNDIEASLALAQDAIHQAMN